MDDKDIFTKIDRFYTVFKAINNFRYNWTNKVKKLNIKESFSLC